MRPRYKKVINDLKTDLLKNMLLVLAIAIGVFGIGTILGGYTVLKREMTTNYMGTNPASATFIIEKDVISKSLLDSVISLPNVKTAERHATIAARMKIKGEWRPMLIFVVDDFENIRTNKFNYISGAKIPGHGQMLAERTAVPVMKTELGGKVIVKTASGNPTELTLTGIVHDPSLAPARQEETGYIYITLQTLHNLGETQNLDELRILFNNPNLSSGETIAEARAVATYLEGNSYELHQMQVPPPRMHPHQSQMTAILSLFTLFSFMILVLSSVLVATSISTLMVKQVREIGIMKTIGATSSQISILYILMILIVSTLAITFAIPLSQLATPLLYKQISELLNLTIFDCSIPHWVIVVQVFSGIIIPLTAALFPTIRGSKTTIRMALDNHGQSEPKSKKAGFGKQLATLNFFGESFNLSMRNVFRKRARLIMTLLLLGAGGAMFMSAQNISSAWDANLSKIYIYRHYDLEITFNNAINTKSILAKINKIPGVKSAENWVTSAAAVTQDVSYDIVNTYPDKGHGGFFMLGSSVKTELISLPLQEGEWLKDENANDVVLNQIARSFMADVQIGDSISLSLENVAHKWRIIGFVEDVGSPATAFVSINTFRKLMQTGDDRSNMLRIAYKNREAKDADRVTMEIEKLMERENIPVIRSVPVSLLHNAMAAHMGVLVNSLFSISILMGLVGALGLMSAMSMNIIERTRELGVLRAIGATPKKIRNLVVGEGLITGLTSIVLAFILSLFISSYIGQLVGDMAFKTPLSLSISHGAFLIWVLIIIMGSIAATFYPANRAIKTTTREALSYE